MLSLGVGADPRLTRSSANAGRATPSASTDQAAVRGRPVRLGGSVDTSTAPAFTPDPDHPYAHPYYWAPFILMGNWL